MTADLVPISCRFIETYDSAEARKLVQHQITAIDTDMAKREVKAAQHGNFSNQMPQRRQITERQEHIRNAGVELFSKSSRRLFH